MTKTRESPSTPWIKPRYVWEDKDRHGNLRRYVARPGQRKIRIHPDPQAEPQAFAEAYALAIDGVTLPKKLQRPPPIDLAIVGSFRWLIEIYRGSGDFLDLDAQTRAQRRNVMASICEEPIAPGSPHKMDKIPLGKITSSHVRMLRDRKREWPEAANHRIKTLRGLFKWALAQDDVMRRFPLAGNPARDVSSLKGRNRDGFHTWTLEEVERFEATHAAGSKARLALALLMYTSQRKSDVILFGRQHVRQRPDLDDPQLMQTWLFFTQRKNQRRKPVDLALPILDVLQSALDDARPVCGDATFLVNDCGRPFTVGSFGNRFRKWCDAAGLPQCSAHGLRKASATIAAENGATERQLMAINGWSDPKMAAHYTKKARQAKLAGDAMKLILPTRKSASANAQTV